MANGRSMDRYNDKVLQIETESSHRMDDVPMEPISASISPVDQLERYGRWLSSIPRDDIIVLRETPEYHDFLRAFERLGQAHRRVVSMNRSSVSMDESQDDKFSTVPRPFVTNDLFASFTNNFMQHLTADDVVLRIFEFLECQSLIRMALTCSRFRQLAYRSAHQRTHDVANSRQLNSVMKLLRAKEQIDGVGGHGLQDSHVRVPILLLSRRVLVTNAGDPEMNGVYFCTGSNGNGFVFTKARFPEQRVQWTLPQQQSQRHQQAEPASLVPRNPPRVLALPPGGLEMEIQVIGPHPHEGVGINVRMAPGGGPVPLQHGPTSRLESEAAHPGQPLRCILSKRFSGESILWYLSKEVLSTEPDVGVRAGGVKEVFKFWSKLMLIENASLDECRYPSQSSILARTHESWHALHTTRDLHPPTVELLDG